MTELFQDLPLLGRMLSILLVAAVAHGAVMVLRRLAQRLLKSTVTERVRKGRTIVTLATSVVVFVIYFVALGKILGEFGIPLGAYLASASVIGLAVGFGSQGVVQDVVTGLTLIFSNLLDVGEMVNIGGQIGVVKAIGMRFVELENSFGSRVSIPNRTITSVISFPRGYLRSIVDVTLSQDPEVAEQQAQICERMLPAVAEQFPGIMRFPPSIEGRVSTSSGRDFLRIKFRIWPDRAEPLAQSFRQELLSALKRMDDSYADWMVAVHFEVEQPTPRRRR